MSILDFVTIAGFGLTCFVLGYTLGKHDLMIINMPHLSR